MRFSESDVAPFTQTDSNLSKLADQANAGAEKMIAKNGESRVALNEASRPECNHLLERERIHLLLINDTQHGLADITAGRTFEADAALTQLQQRRSKIAHISSLSAGGPPHHTV